MMLLWCCGYFSLYPSLLPTSYVSYLHQLQNSPPSYTSLPPLSVVCSPPDRLSVRPVWVLSFPLSPPPHLCLSPPLPLLPWLLLFSLHRPQPHCLRHSLHWNLHLGLVSGGGTSSWRQAVLFPVLVPALPLLRLDGAFLLLGNPECLWWGKRRRQEEKGENKIKKIKLGYKWNNNLTRLTKPQQKEAGVFSDMKQDGAAFSSMNQHAWGGRHASWLRYHNQSQPIEWNV